MALGPWYGEFPGKVLAIGRAKRVKGLKLEFGERPYVHIPDVWGAGITSKRPKFGELVKSGN